MARPKTVQITMITGTEYFVPEAEFNSMGIPESPDSVIGNYIRGTRGPMLRVNTLADMTGTYKYVNPQMIVDLDITLL